MTDSEREILHRFFDDPHDETTLADMRELLEKVDVVQTESEGDGHDQGSSSPLKYP